MSYCLPIDKAEKFVEALRSDKINPGELSIMSSAERRQFFSKLVGKENAVQVNTLFESKLLLKNQQEGMVSWAKQVTGISEPVRRTMLEKIKKLDKAIEGQDQQSFLEDIVSKRLGIDVKLEDAQKLLDTVKSIETKKAAIKEDSPIRSPERIEYGVEVALLKQTIEELKIGNSTMLVEYLKNPRKSLFTISGISKSILASLDNSFFFRQGLKTLATNPDIWINAFIKSWRDITKELRGIDAMIPIRADVYSRPNAINGKYEAGKFALGLAKEEAFPSSLPGRIPILGRLFKASESAYNGGALRMRADLADRLIAKAEKFGVDTSDPLQVRSIGKLVNSMTGRGDIGKLEVFGEEINAALFSIKFLKSNWDTLTAHTFGTGLETSFARKQAVINLLKITGVIAGTLATAEMLYPGSVDYDPRSANFGKIKISDTRFDVTGGMSSMVTLASRIVPTTHKGKWGWWYKSSTRNKFVQLGTDKYGAKTPIEVVYSFGEGKTSPLFHTLINIMRQQNFKGDVPTVESELKTLVTPLPIMTFFELRNNPDSANWLISLIASELGVGVNTYSKTK